LYILEVDSSSGYKYVCTVVFVHLQALLPRGLDFHSDAFRLATWRPMPWLALQSHAIESWRSLVAGGVVYIDHD
jgi:hypothetical protein